LFEGLFCPRCRAKRVTALLVGVILMSLGDLYMTLQYVMHYGLLEANPFARAMMDYGSPSLLVAWKLFTLLLTSGILFFARRRLSAELGAIFCCGVLTWLTVRWLDYSDQMAHMPRESQALVTQDESRWVTLVPGG
jgi:hypothetical protein